LRAFDLVSQERRTPIVVVALPKDRCFQSIDDIEGIVFDIRKHQKLR
jgi:hypothetical protein